jgi:transcriptional regulator with XRE-family HTH domain
VPDTLHSARHKLLIGLLVEARRRAHLTQAQVAARLGRQQSFVANIEGNLRRVDVVEFLDLADAIGFEPSDLIAKLRKEKASHRRRSR